MWSVGRVVANNNLMQDKKRAMLLARSYKYDVEVYLFGSSILSAEAVVMEAT